MSHDLDSGLVDRINYECRGNPYISDSFSEMMITDLPTRI